MDLHIRFAVTRQNPIFLHLCVRVRPMKSMPRRTFNQSSKKKFKRSLEKQQGKQTTDWQRKSNWNYGRFLTRRLRNAMFSGVKKKELTAQKPATSGMFPRNEATIDTL